MCISLSQVFNKHIRHIIAVVCILAKNYCVYYVAASTKNCALVKPYSKCHDNSKRQENMVKIPKPC